MSARVMILASPSTSSSRQKMTVPREYPPLPADRSMSEMRSAVRAASQL